MTASIYDVARGAGVSPGTVSRVLNGHGHFSENTRKRVISAARAAQFRPKLTSRRQTIGLVLDHTHHAKPSGFLSLLQSHLAQELARHELAVQLYTESSLEGLGEVEIDGLISIAWDAPTVRRLRQVQQNTGVPVIEFTGTGGEGFSLVEGNHEQGGRLVGELLNRHGHQRIAYLIHDHTPGLTRRLRGMTDYLAEQGITFDPSLVGLTRGNSMDDVLRRLLDRKPTAIFIAVEDKVPEAMSILQDKFGLSIPGDLSLVGMESPLICRYARPPLTAVRQPLDQMAVVAVEIMLDLIHSKAEPVHRMLDNELIERCSVDSPATSVPLVSG